MAFGVYLAYDVKRDRFVMDFQAADDAAAKEEFSSWYRTTTRLSRWEHRKLLRYNLWRIGEADSRNGPERKLPKPLLLMWDEEVRLSWSWFWMSDPPCNEEEDEWSRREFERLDALDAARLARRGNQAA